MGPAVMEAKSAIVRCNFYADGPEAAITIGGIDRVLIPMSQPTAHLMVPFFRVVFSVWQYGAAAFGWIYSLFQVYNPSETRTVTVFVDNFDIYLLDEDVCYPGEFLDQI